MLNYSYVKNETKEKKKKKAYTKQHNKGSSSTIKFLGKLLRKKISFKLNQHLHNTIQCSAMQCNAIQYTTITSTPYYQRHHHKNNH